MYVLEIIGNTLYIKCWLIDCVNPNHKILHGNQRKCQWISFSEPAGLDTGGVEPTEGSVSKATALELPLRPPEDVMETGSEF